MVGALPTPGFVKRSRKHRECKRFGHGGLQASEEGSGPVGVLGGMLCDHCSVLPFSEPHHSLRTSEAMGVEFSGGKRLS